MKQFKFLVSILLSLAPMMAFAGPSYFDHQSASRITDSGQWIVMDLDRGGSITCAHPQYGSYLVAVRKDGVQRTFAFGSDRVEALRNCLNVQAMMFASPLSTFRFMTSETHVWSWKKL